MAPVTKGTATLVPLSVSDWPSEPRLVMPSPGALKPARANRAAQIRFVDRPATQITGHYRDNPRVTGNGGTSERALIARRRNDQHTASERLIERLFQRLFPLGGRLCQGQTQVDDSRACVEALQLAPFRMLQPYFYL